MAMHPVTIVSCTPTTVGVAIFEDEGQQKLIPKQRVEWSATPDQYDSVFTTIKETYHVHTIRILVSEDDTYCKQILFPPGTEPTRNMVLEEAKTTIPDLLDEQFFDWKKVSNTQEGVYVQIYAVKKSVMQPMIHAAKSSGLTIESCEPPSFALARLTYTLPGISLLLYPEEKPQYLYAVQKGSVLEVFNVDQAVSVERMTATFSSYTEKQWGSIPNRVPTTNLDPAVGLALKTDFEGEDKDVLNITGGSGIVEVKEKKRFPWVYVIIGIGLVIEVIVFVFIRFAGGS